MRTLIGLSTLMAALVAPSANAAEQTWYVANNGADTNTCGSSAAPCRSINLAINHARAGDTVLVRPGRYGDINSNGVSDPGDEYSNVSESCLVCVDRPLRIRSTHGAAVTIIDAAHTRNSFVVRILSSNVTFGSPGNGFSIVNGPVEGLAAAGDLDTRLDHITIADNIVAHNRQNGLVVRNVSAATVDHNTAFDNQQGFELQMADAGIISHNISTHNLLGFGFGGPATSFIENVSSFNGQGVFVSGTGVRFEHNTVSNNGIDGVVVLSGTLASFAENSLIGNQGPGITLFNGTGITKFQFNNIFSNGTSFQSFTGEPPNCGLYNASRAQILALNNYWGSAKGPGADPADAVCNLFESKTVFTPFAKSVLPVDP